VTRRCRSRDAGVEREGENEGGGRQVAGVAPGAGGAGAGAGGTGAGI
jgi:hypothetical protein